MYEQEIDKRIWGQPIEAQSDEESDEESYDDYNQYKDSIFDTGQFDTETQAETDGMATPEVQIRKQNFEFTIG